MRKSFMKMKNNDCHFDLLEGSLEKTDRSRSLPPVFEGIIFQIKGSIPRSINTLVCFLCGLIVCLSFFFFVKVLRYLLSLKSFLIFLICVVCVLFIYNFGMFFLFQIFNLLLIICYTGYILVCWQSVMWADVFLSFLHTHIYIDSYRENLAIFNISKILPCSSCYPDSHFPSV